MTYDELYHDITQILPRATFSVDNNGQLIIYTDKQFGEDNRTLLNFEHPEVCPKHNMPWVDGTHEGRRRCQFYVPELGVSEDYGCPQPK